VCQSQSNPVQESATPWLQCKVAHRTQTMDDRLQRSSLIPPLSLRTVSKVNRVIVCWRHGTPLPASPTRGGQRCPFGAAAFIRLIAAIGAVPGIPARKRRTGIMGICTRNASSSSGSSTSASAFDAVFLGLTSWPPARFASCPLLRCSSGCATLSTEPCTETGICFPVYLTPPPVPAPTSG
jgi:hypothetical protein